MYRKAVSTPQVTRAYSLRYKDQRLTEFVEVIAVYSEKHQK